MDLARWVTGLRHRRENHRNEGVARFDGRLSQLTMDMMLRDCPWVDECHEEVSTRLRTVGILSSLGWILRRKRDIDAKIALTEKCNVWTSLRFDHSPFACFGIQTAARGSQWDGLEALHQAVGDPRDWYRERIAPSMGPNLLHDLHPRLISDDCQSNLRFPVITNSPSGVQKPPVDGSAVRFMGVYKKQSLWLRHFRAANRLEAVLPEVNVRYHLEWILPRRGCLRLSHRRLSHGFTHQPVTA